MIEIKKTNDKGWGVFANQLIKKGSLIECCPAFVIRLNVSTIETRPVLRDHLWEWDDKVAFAAGYGSLYNHSYTPNAHHIKHFDIDEIHFHALRDISPGEEITVNYNGDPDCQDSMWFEVK